MRIVDGKFIKDNNIIPVEIGNLEQIATLQKQEKLLTEIEKNGSIPEILVKRAQIEYKVSFQCSCGRNLSLDDEDLYYNTSPSDLEYDIQNDVDGYTIKCHHCKLEWEFDEKRGRFLVKEPL